MLFFIAARHRHHRHPFAKKITHSRFPKGGYILVHYPLAHRIFSSNRNQLDENTISSELLSNDLSNDVRMQYETVGHINNDSVKHKYISKFKRDAIADPMDIELCCSHSTRDECSKLNCFWNRHFLEKCVVNI